MAEVLLALGHWSFELGHSLVIGHWSLIIMGKEESKHAALETLSRIRSRLGARSLILGCASLMLAAPGYTAEAEMVYHAPALAITNGSGVAVSLFSAAAYRAEFKYL